MTPEQKSARVKALVVIAAILCVVGVLSLIGYFVIKSLLTGNGYNEFKRLIDENWLLGAAAMLLINFTQVVIAFIPGEIVEQASGLFFGTEWGTLICLGGTVLGSSFALFLSKRFGQNLVYSICPKEKLDSISFLSDPKKRDFWTFTLFFMPGTPKDVLTYAVGLTDMSIPRYIALTTFARLPSILMSTVSGDWISSTLLGDNKIWPILILNGASLIICLIGYLMYMLISKKHAQRAQKRAKNSSEEA